MKTIEVESFLQSCSIDPEVYSLAPGYRAMLLVVTGLKPAESDAISEQLLGRAEAAAAQWLSESAVEELPQVVVWRNAYLSFGAKPQRTRNSLEALLRRAATGLPRVNHLTDVYNAISILHRIPLGGENLDNYVGPARLVRADGSENFDTTADGHAITESPEVGEVVWRDEMGVTCRRWNWRQCKRTALTPETSNALFIFDALAPMTDAELESAVDELKQHLAAPGVQFVQRILGAAQ